MVAHGPLAANPILWAKATLRRYRLPDQLRARILFGIAPGGACHAGPVASPPVGSYSTVSPLPMRTWAVSFLWRFPSGLPARALPGTITLWSPDFPRGKPRGHPATRATCAYFAIALRSTEIYRQAPSPTHNLLHPAFPQPSVENASERPQAACLSTDLDHILFV